MWPQELPLGPFCAPCRLPAWTTWRSAWSTGSTGTSSGRAGPTVSAARGWGVTRLLPRPLLGLWESGGDPDCPAQSHSEGRPRPTGWRPWFPGHSWTGSWAEGGVPSGTRDRSSAGELCPIGRRCGSRSLVGAGSAHRKRVSSNPLLAWFTPHLSALSLSLRVTVVGGERAALVPACVHR